MFKKIFHNRYFNWYRHAKQLFVFDVILLLGIVTLVGVGLFLYFYGLPVTRKVNLTVTPEINIANFRNGENLPMLLSYENTSEALLKDVKITLITSPGYTPEEGSVFNNETAVTTLPDLAPGANGTLTFDGTLLSSVDANARIITLLSYKQETRSVREEKTASFVLTPEQITKPALTITSDARETIYTEQTIKETVEICNPSATATIPAGTLNLHLTNGESIESTASLAHFDPTECETVTFTYTAEKPGDLTHTLWYSILQEGAATTIAKTEHQAEVKDLRPEITIAPESSVLSPGETQTLNVVLRNPHDVALENINFTIPAAGVLTKTVKASPASHTELLTLAPGQEVAFSLPITAVRSPFTQTQNDQTTLRLQPEITLTHQDQELTYTTDSVQFTVPTQASLSAISRYFSPYGDQLGRGPIPPVAGFETKYWVFINVSADFGPLENVTLTANTAPGAHFTGKQSMTAGSLDANSASTRVWNADQIDANQTHGIYLEVGITPGNTQVGSTPNLLQNITLVGIDPRSATSVTRSLGQVSADLRYDDFAKDYATEVLAP